MDNLEDNLEDCLLEVFDEFEISEKSSGNFVDFGWCKMKYKSTRGDDFFISICNIPNHELLYRILNYIKLKKDMIKNRLGYGIGLGYSIYGGRGSIFINIEYNE